MRRRRALLGAALCTALAAGPIASPAHAAPTRPSPLTEVGFDQKLGQGLPLDLPFRDETGREVRLRDYFDRRPVLLVPAYYECPMLCTLVLQGVVRALRAMAFDVGREFTIVTFSFDPRDRPPAALAKKTATLAEYQRPGAAEGWHFLTGDAASIAALTQAIGFRSTWDDATQQFAHASGVVVATPQGQIARYFFGIEFAPRDLRLALVEAAQDRIGSLVDQLLLFCFHYDPATGRYSATVLGIIRMAGVATLLALGTFMLRAGRMARS